MIETIPNLQIKTMEIEGAIIVIQDRQIILMLEVIAEEVEEEVEDLINLRKVSTNNK